MDTPGKKKTPESKTWGMPSITLMEGNVGVGMTLFTRFESKFQHLLCHFEMTKGHSVISMKMKTRHWIGFLEVVFMNDLQEM